MSSALGNVNLNKSAHFPPGFWHDAIVADLVLRSKFLHRRARRIGARCADSVLSSFAVLGVENSRWRARVGERWAFSFMVTSVVRFLALIGFFFFWFNTGFLFTAQGLLDLARKVKVEIPKIVGDAAEVRFIEWYRLAAVLCLLFMLILACVYAARPLLPLNLVLGNRDAEANFHRGSLYALERRMRAALILYGHAARCARALMARGWVRDSLTNSARFLPQAEREILRAWKKARPARVKTLRYQRNELKDHAGRVVAALRAQAARVDADPENGLRELGKMLIRVGDRLAEGRVGALLDEEELEGLEPVRDREVLRTVTAALLVAAAAVGVAALQLPAEVAAPLTTLTGIVVLVTLYRKAGGAETVSLLLGGK